ncbi:MAG: flagellar basal body P-ring formation chaperone FlgA [Planctomycetota bacterium]
MNRKDCENTTLIRARRKPAPSAVFFALLAASMVSGSPSTAAAGQVRVWSSAVVVTDSIRLADLAEVRGFDADEESRLAQVVVTEAPRAGGSRMIHIAMIRTVLAASGVNMAGLTFGGATQCEVSRPSQLAPARLPDLKSQISNTGGPEGARRESVPQVWRPGSPAEGTASATTEKAIERTLRDAVREYFNGEFGRYGGTAEVIFDHTDEQVLDLSGPAYDFNVRRRGGPPLGLCSLEIDVLSNARTVQTIPLVAQVTMQRRVVVARRSINQGAPVAPADVEAVPMSFTRLDQLGLDDVTMAIGQRAKRFISAGSTIDVDVLEAVPLVLRGQLVTLSSTAGGVRIVTTAKAGADGMLGETIKVRSADDKRLEYDAVVIGPGEVRVGAGRSDERNEARFAWRDKP